MVLLLLRGCCRVAADAGGVVARPGGGSEGHRARHRIAVLVALMGVGLASTAPDPAWRSWSPAWRLLLVAIPDHRPFPRVGARWVSLTPMALLLGRASPTDPVLAGDVQVEGPAAVARGG
jgi:hypothetical protein